MTFSPPSPPIRIAGAWLSTLLAPTLIFACDAARIVQTGPSTPVREIVIERQVPSIALTIGETLIARSERDTRWIATIDPPVLEPLAQSDGGAAQWQFRAVKSGDAELVLTEVVRADCPNPPNCPSAPAPRRFTIAVHVDPRTP